MSILEQLQSILPDVRFEPSTTFCWSPEGRTIKFSREALEHDEGIWALLHEAGHALLGHSNYTTDLELLSLEVAAWERAKALGKEIDILIDDDHIQDCLDTYRDWLHRRGTCPTCGTVSLQRNENTYACHNCSAVWKVTRARLCRPYRLLAQTDTAATATSTPALFH